MGHILLSIENLPKQSYPYSHFNNIFIQTVYRYLYQYGYTRYSKDKLNNIRHGIKIDRLSLSFSPLFMLTILASSVVRFMFSSFRLFPVTLSRKRGSSSFKFTLIYGVPRSFVSRNRFSNIIEFLLFSHSAKERNSLNIIYIEYPEERIIYKDRFTEIRLTPDPVFLQARERQLSFKKWLSGYLGGLRCILKFLHLGRENIGWLLIAHTEIWSSFLIKSGSIENKVELIISNTNMQNQPGWMRHLSQLGKSKMYCYSSNSINASFKGIDQKGIRSPIFRNVETSELWGVGSALDGQRYVNLGFKGKLREGLPITWSRGDDSFWKRNNVPVTIDITIFDHLPSLIHKEYYWSHNTMKFFYEDILKAVSVVEQCLGRNLRVARKGKRSYFKGVDPDYVDLISTLDNSSHLTSFPDETCINELIKSSQLVISVPWTSPSMMARLMDVPGIYYDPLGIISIADFNPNRYDDYLVSSYPSLVEAIKKYISRT